MGATPLWLLTSHIEYKATTNREPTKLSGLFATGTQTLKIIKPALVRPGFFVDVGRVVQASNQLNQQGYC